MIQIKDKTQCCGCEACVDVCPKNCISMSMDEEGFRYPVVDETKCVKCGLCDKTCHMKKEFTRGLSSKTEFFAAHSKDLSEVLQASSGGIFFEIAKDFICNLSGVVYGVSCIPPYYITHERAETIEECEKLKKSKYLQSHLNGSFSKAKKDLLNGRYVLFSGTPCQVAALYKFLGKEFERLYTIEVICHGVPSELIYKKYIDYLEERENSKVIETCWRDKEFGWGPNHISFNFENGKRISTTSDNNDFQYGFLRNYYLRPSCYSCKYAKLPRIADISLADYWGYEGTLNSDNQNSGISAVIISTNNGRWMWDRISHKLVFHEVAEDDVKRHSRHAWLHPEKNPVRPFIFRKLQNKTFQDISKQLHGYLVYKYVRQILIRINLLKERIFKNK